MMGRRIAMCRIFNNNHVFLIESLNALWTCDAVMKLNLSNNMQILKMRYGFAPVIILLNSADYSKA